MEKKGSPSSRGTATYFAIGQKRARRRLLEEEEPLERALKLRKERTWENVGETCVLSTLFVDSLIPSSRPRCVGDANVIGPIWSHVTRTRGSAANSRKSATDIRELNLRIATFMGFPPFPFLVTRCFRDSTSVFRSFRCAEISVAQDS